MGTLHMDEYDEQAMIDNGILEYEIDYDLVFGNDAEEIYITVVINNIPEWRKAHKNKEGYYVDIGTKKVKV